MWYGPTAAYMSYMYTGAGAEVLRSRRFVLTRHASHCAYGRVARTGTARADARRRCRGLALAVQLFRSPLLHGTRSTSRERRRRAGLRRYSHCAEGD
jgi:hypothetical protein